MKRAAQALAALGVALASALIVVVVLVARSRAEPPARCADGMVALGPRCCGEGQRLESGRCSGAPARCAKGMVAAPSGCTAPPRTVHLDGGTLRIGPGDWEAQGTVQPLIEAVASFAIDAYEVTEDRYAACESAGACAPIVRSGEPGRAIVGVSLAEAMRFCAWAGGSVPSSAELAFATAGPGSRRYAWGDTGAVCRRAAWGLREGPCVDGTDGADRADGPELAGSHPDGATPTGIHDLSGNVAEWTRPVDPEAASADVRGGSWADGAASALRSWHRRVVPVTERSPEIGFRCVYSALR